MEEVWFESAKAAEQALVGLAITDPTAALGSGVSVEQLFAYQNRHIWSAVTGLVDRGEEVDAVRIGDVLAVRGVLPACGGLAYLSSLAISAGLPSMAASYAEVVKRGWLNRELRLLGARIGESLTHGTQPIDVIQQIQSRIADLEGASTPDTTTLAEECERQVEKLKVQLSGGHNALGGLPTGLGLELLVPGGIPRDKVTILYGETGTYKTAVKQVLIDAIAAAGGTSLDFTIEDSAELTAHRYLARQSGVPYAKISSGLITSTELQKFSHRKALEKNVHIVGNVPATIEEAVRVSRALSRRLPGGLSAVFVDYVNLMEMDVMHESREAAGLYHIAKVAQRAAHRDKIAWVLLSQMNAKVDARQDKRPHLGDLYGSSGLKHTAKLALATHRPSKYERVPSKGSPWYEVFNQHPNGPEIYAHALELIVRKGFGRCNEFLPLYVDPPTGRIRPMSDSERPASCEVS